MEKVLTENPVKSDIKLLIVDDREDNLFSIETILEQDGYIIRTANSGRAALRILLKEEDFTLILMDVQMPDLNGFETATLIYERDKLKHIPIIFVTANDYGDESVFKGYKMGGVDYIYKPVNPELLRAKVSVFVELYRKNHLLIAQDQKMAAANKRLEQEIKDRINSEAKVKMLNMQLMENINRLKVTNEELERFAYVASHDLQEPLRKIILFSDKFSLKYKDVLNEESNDYIMRIMKAAERMRALIKNILIFSRSAVNDDVFEPTDLNVLLQGIISDLEVSIEQKKAVVNIGSLPTITIVQSQFRQVFQNLIMNALKFSRENAPPEITIYAEQVKVNTSKRNSKPSGDYYTIYVKDNGIGFEQKYADEIFTLFKRLNSADKFEGTGIGLSICKKIVELHHGHISASSKIDEGATFSISLPVGGVKDIAEAVN
ncbi:hybrid sensor histidine kinase/response regulator [Flavipsychrobacter stenotrophus]|uniref:histidine kinase n=1 Tax=Flavipsychrobacter stenotrophus TaxID=2077091 RepID=A0A2S7SQG7_9BACT|nr:response regulator [Flavipsychrobacter stenotrophus]PQJ09149.1 hybrid sensor histidine kinase/response regulator [Flavipsychrobacter stenotrophus]